MSSSHDEDNQQAGARTSLPVLRRILLPIVGGPTEQAAIDHAAVLAIALRASITLVHVDEVPGAMVGIVPGASVEGDLAAERIRSTEWLDQIADALAARGVAEVQIEWLVSPAVASALVEHVRREDFDLVVMATHARTGLSRAMLGSVAEHVVRHALCPVLMVHSS
jgi:nucleotide-binding universal stress UspA family protein